jgi:hypothetical protein
MGMDKRALWSKVFAAVALALMAVGWVLITLVGHRLGYGTLLVFGIVLATTGAFFSESSSRKLVLWGAGGTAAAMAPGFALGIISGLEGKAPFVHPIFIAIIVIMGGLSQIAIVVGTIGILLEEKRPASPPVSGGTGEDLTGATPADPGRLRSAEGIKRIGRKKGLVWGAVLAAVPLLVIGIFLLTRGGEKTDEPQKVYAEGQYFSVGSTREEVLRIQGPPTFKLEMVWFYEDSQVQFDSDGKVNYVWDYSKNLKIKPEKRP